MVSPDFRMVPRHTVGHEPMLYLLEARLGHFLDPFPNFSVLFGDLSFAPAVCHRCHVHVTLVWPSLSSVNGVERLATGHVDTQQSATVHDILFSH